MDPIFKPGVSSRRLQAVSGVFTQQLHLTQLNSLLLLVTEPAVVTRTGWSCSASIVSLITLTVYSPDLTLQPCFPWVFHLCVEVKMATVAAQ